MSSTLGALVAIVAILAGLSAFAGFIAVGRQRGMVNDLKGRAEFLEASVRDRNEKITWLEGQNTAKDAELAGLHRELDALRKVVTGEVFLQTLIELLNSHHQAAIGGQNVIRAQLADVLGLLGDKRSRAERGEPRPGEGEKL